nr:TPA_asm: coat protein [Viola ophiovirus]
MSKIRTSELKSLHEKYEKDQANLDDAEWSLLKEFKICYDNRALNPSNLVVLKEMANSDKDWLLTVDEAGSLEQCPIQEETNKPPPEPRKRGQETKKNNERGEGSKVMKSGAELMTNLSGQNFQVDASRVKAELEKFYNNLPADGQGYSANEVKIFRFGDLDSEFSLCELLGAGTKPLDALLFVSLATDEKSNGMFDIHKIESYAEEDMSFNIRQGRGLIRACTIMVWIQGFLPSIDSTDTRPIPAYLLKHLIELNVTKMQDLPELLSCTSTRKFCQKIFFEINLNILPLNDASRCKLSVAGNKIVKYAISASRFERRGIPAFIPGGTEAENLRNNAERKKVKQAFCILEYLLAVQTDLEAMKKMHPMSPERPTTPGLTRKITCAIIYSLTDKGRVDLYNHLKQKQNTAFLQDETLVGKPGEPGRRVYPELNTPEGDFSSITVETLKNMYGKDFTIPPELA